jgi:hypothetical protein
MLEVVWLACGKKRLEVGSQISFCDAVSDEPPYPRFKSSPRRTRIRSLISDHRPRHPQKSPTLSSARSAWKQSGECRGQGSNLHSLRNQILSLARLPISPPRQVSHESTPAPVSASADMRGAGRSLPETRADIPFPSRGNSPHSRASPPQRFAGAPDCDAVNLHVNCELSPSRESGSMPLMSTSPPKWSFEAEFIQACNCDYGCPCEFSAPPTRGFCDGTGAWRITKGSFGNVALDGLTVGFAAHWPKAIHEGGGTLALFIDERATADQRNALLTICSGQAGGLPFEILSTTISTVLDPVFAPVAFTFNGRESSVRVGDALNVALEPIKNPVTKEPEHVRVEHSTGFIFKSAEAVSGKECRVNVPGLAFSWPDKAAFVTTVTYGN